ncbi:hypothetical protein EYZ11_013507 [Aspergillus tanneri]|nr:hypothetical protein EYZ11_013507 [Aspergillus tanneri]
MAMEMAKTAKRALDFELAIRSTTSGPSDSSAATLAAGYWETSPDGILSGQALWLDLKRIEAVYRESNTHDYEMVKTVSLRQINPLALLTLQEKGDAEFDIPEVLFDLDFPGHFCRRIVSVAVSIPCIVGANTNLSCTLSLNQHKYRISSSADGYDAQKAAAFRTDRIPITSIAVSSGVRDTGALDLDFRGNEQYGPFEGAGAISTWHISLPKTLRQFDYSSITDVVLHLRYTAFGAGGLLEMSASTAVNKWAKQPTIPAPGSEYGRVDKVLAVDLANDYPSEWQQVCSTGTTTLQNLDQRLPFWARTATKSSAITLLITPKPDSPNPQIRANGITAKAEASGPLGEYSTYQFKQGLDVTKPWTIKNLNHDHGFQRAWLLIQYSI